MGNFKCRLLFFAPMLALGGCADYEFSVNDKLVYTPLPLFSDFLLADPALQTCVSQTISDEKITSAELLERLNCSHAGIQSVEGLDGFTHLKVLNLGHNKLRDVGSLSLLPQLQQLNLFGNAELDCVSVDNWPTTPELQLPLHCRNAQ